MTIRKAMTLSIAMAMAACGDDDVSTVDANVGMDSAVETDANVGTDSAMPDEDAGPSSSSLTASFEGLPQLGDDYVYEGWVIVDEAPVSTGRFSVTSTDGTHEEVVTLPAGAGDAAMYVLTIEPAEGDDPAPASTHVVAGAFDAGSATLTIEHPAALGDGFADAAGTYILATPSNENATPNQGIWFLVPPAGDEGPSASLTLPALPEGWVYEGWVVADGMPVSTGTFTTPAGADSDGGGETAGPMDTPPFPGQDFIDPARDLSTGHMAVISIEPSPDNAPGPFQLKPLGGPIEGDSPHTLNNIIAGNTISGSAVIAATE